MNKITKLSVTIDQAETVSIRSSESDDVDTVCSELVSCSRVDHYA